MTHEHIFADRTRDTEAVCTQKGPLGREIASLSPDLRRLIDLAADWSGSARNAERRRAATERHARDNNREQEQHDRMVNLARMVLGECLTHWHPKQRQAKRAAAVAAKAN
jgi:hypothetical protein